MAILNQKPVSIGDLLKSEYGSNYCRESFTVTNNTGSAITLKVGHPIGASGALIAAAGIANTKGLVLQETVLAVGEAKKVPCLMRGPAIIDVDVLPTTDYAGASINMTNFKTALAALTPAILLRTEPPHQEEEPTV